MLWSGTQGQEVCFHVVHLEHLLCEHSLHPNVLRKLSKDKLPLLTVRFNISTAASQQIAWIHLLPLGKALTN